MLVHRRCFIISCDARDMLCMAVPAAVADLMDFAVKTIVEKCLQLRGRGGTGIEQELRYGMGTSGQVT